MPYENSPLNPHNGIPPESELVEILTKIKSRNGWGVLRSRLQLTAWIAAWSPVWGWAGVVMVAFGASIFFFKDKGIDQITASLVFRETTIFILLGAITAYVLSIAGANLCERLITKNSLRKLPTYNGQYFCEQGGVIYIFGQPVARGREGLTNGFWRIVQEMNNDFPGVVFESKYSDAVLLGCWGALRVVSAEEIETSLAKKENKRLLGGV